MRRVFATVVFLFSVFMSMAQSSVLSEGTWFRVGITETGIYKIDRNTLNVLGAPSSIDPRKIKISRDPATGE